SPRWRPPPSRHPRPPGAGASTAPPPLAVGARGPRGRAPHPAIPYEGIRGCDVAVQVETADEAERLFAALSEGGTVQMPIGETWNCVRFGMLTDRFGVPGMINCEKAAGA